MTPWLVLAQAVAPAAPQVTQSVSQDPAIIAAAIVLVLSSLGGTVVLIVNAVSASKDRREAAMERRLQLELSQRAEKYAADTAKKTDALVVESAKIHTLTNDTNSQLQKALELKNQELMGFKELLAKMVEEKRETAAMRVVTDLQTAAALATPVPVAVIPVVASVRGSRASDAAPLAPAAEETLKNIEKNTGETAEGIKDLKDP